MRTWIAVFLFSAVWFAQPAAAQGTGGSGERAGKWETRLGIVFQDSADADFDGGTTATLDSDTGFRLGIAYHYTDRLEFGLNLDLAQTDYDARVVGDEPGEIFPINGELEYTNTSFDATFNFMPGRFSPFILGSLGWSWVDTNIATEPPQTGCWWDPWWGYICTTFQDTKTIDGFTYEAGIGARFDINDVFAVHASYRKTWHDWDNADGSVDVDSAILSFGWKF
jgi:opacity protein-like surface antigen